MAKDETWKDVMMDRIGKSNNRRERRSVGVNLPADLNRVVQAAAAKRDMSMGAYMRRATIAMACHDLELDWDEVMAAEPRVRAYSSNTINNEQDLKGQGFGLWRITGLK